MSDTTSKRVIIDNRISCQCLEFLINNGYECVKIPCIDVLDKAVAAHPDMSAVKIADNWIIYYDVAHLFGFADNKTIINREEPESERLLYPHDVGLNCALVGNKLICNSKYTENEVLKIAKANDIRIVNVRQGYSKCSVCVVSDNAIITEDIGIAKKCFEHKIDVLLLKNKTVKLEGYAYGFIGGCSGTLSDGRIIFAGCIENHPEIYQIRKFCEKYKKTVVSMSNEPLCDVGSILEV